jgi:cardiolipin synthase
MISDWHVKNQPVYFGGNEIRLLRCGSALFPTLQEAIDQAKYTVGLATYIFNDDASALSVLEALERAAQRGVQVSVVVDGFGSKPHIPMLKKRLESAGAKMAVFRPIDSWRSWFQPEHLRRLHQKLCVVDGKHGFVGGINVVDDYFDVAHGWESVPRLDYAVQLKGPVVKPIDQTICAIWTRAMLGRDWSDDFNALARSKRPVAKALSLWRQARLPRSKKGPGVEETSPMRAAFVVRDNVRQRRTIELSYIGAIRAAKQRVDIVSPYFYPGRAFRRVLKQAAARGVKVRLLMQGRWDYKIAAVAARTVYSEMHAKGVKIFEYTPAFLHAKVAVVDDRWATVGSSNIDPLSLLLNLEANVMVQDPDFVAELGHELDEAFAVAEEIAKPVASGGILQRWHQWVVAAGARLYMRLAGVHRKY